MKNDIEQIYAKFKPLESSAASEWELNKILITYHSTVMEGSTLTYYETELLIKEGLTPNGKPLHYCLMVNDHYRALTYALEQARMKMPVTELLIKTMAEKTNKNTGGTQEGDGQSFDISKGDYRLCPAFALVDDEQGRIVRRYYTNEMKVPALMREFMSQINADMKNVKPAIFDVYKLAFDAHFVLRDIHPFGDGNSRTARLLMNYIQHYFSFPVTPVRATERKGYIHAFYESKDSKTTAAMSNFLFNEAVNYMEEAVKAAEQIKESPEKGMKM